AVLEAVFYRHPGRWQLARLSDGYKGQAEVDGNWRAEEEAARLDCDDCLSIAPSKPAAHLFDRGAEGGYIPQQRCYVAEKNARLGEIRDVPNKGLQVQAGRSILSSASPTRLLLMSLSLRIDCAGACVS